MLYPAELRAGKLEMRIIPCLRWEGKPACNFDIDQSYSLCFTHALKYRLHSPIYFLSTKTNQMEKEVSNVFNTTQ